jgi:hypothetical protein
MTHARKPIEPWDTEKAAQLAAEALRWIGRNYPECAASEVLREHEEAAYEAAMDADEERTERHSELTVEPVETRPYGYVGRRPDANICQQGRARPAPTRELRGQGRPGPGPRIGARARSSRRLESLFTRSSLISERTVKLVKFRCNRANIQGHKCVRCRRPC